MLSYFKREVMAMNKPLALLLIFFLSGFAGSIRIDPVHAGGSTDQDYLQYDDGSAYWYIWDGQWRGVWFNTDDFIPGMMGFDLSFSEYWFYHHAIYPWDVSDFYAEVWNGDYMTPTVLLDQTQVTAIHYAPCFANYNPQLEAEKDFWGLVNTEMSSGGWPAILGDNTPPSVDHSYYSDDFFVWEPWGMGDYFVRVGNFPSALDNVTWGGIKAIF